MTNRPAVTLALAFALLGVLTVTAFAMSLPGVTAPQAHDLPRIVSETDTAASGAGVAASATVPSTVASTPAPVSTSGPGGTHTSVPVAPGGSGSKGSATSADHEVVSPHLHESDEGKQQSAGSSGGQETSNPSASPESSGLSGTSGASDLRAQIPSGPSANRGTRH